VDAGYASNVGGTLTVVFGAIAGNPDPSVAWYTAEPFYVYGDISDPIDQTVNL
jgi:hypothetical protein